MWVAAGGLAEWLVAVLVVVDMGELVGSLEHTSSSREGQRGKWKGVKLGWLLRFRY